MGKTEKKRKKRPRRPGTHCIEQNNNVVACVSSISATQHKTDTPSVAFRHLSPNSARTGYAAEGAFFIFVQLSTDAVTALRKVWVLITLRASLSGTLLQRKDVGNQCFPDLTSKHHFPAPSSKHRFPASSSKYRFPALSSIVFRHLPPNIAFRHLLPNIAFRHLPPNCQIWLRH